MTTPFPLPDNFVPTTLHEAVCTGDFSWINTFIESTVDCDLPAGLLECAAEYGHCDVIKFLVARGADPNEDDGVPFFNAVDFEQQEAAITLLECGATAVAGRLGCPFRKAAAVGLTKVIGALLDRGHQIPAGECQTELFFHQDPPLFAAASGNHRATVELLIERGKFTHEDLFRALNEAACMGNTDVVEVLMDKVPREDLEYITFSAADCGQVSTADLLVEKGGYAKERERGYLNYQNFFGVHPTQSKDLSKIKVGPNSAAWNDIFKDVIHFDGRSPDRDLAELAIDFMVALEPKDPADYSSEDYEKALSDNAQGVEQSNRILRQYAMELMPQTFERLQEEYYSFTNCSKYLESAVVCSVAKACLDEAWSGIAGWSI